MTLRTHLFIFFLFFTPFAFGQTNIDNTLSIEFPGKTDTSIIEQSNIVAKTWAYNTAKESFVLLKVALMENEKEFKTNPRDLAKLFEIYSHDVANQIATMKRKGFDLKDSARINVQGFIGYKVRYTDNSSATPSAESILLFLNGIRYAVIYSKVGEFNENNKTMFLSSLKVLNSKSVQQVDANAISKEEDLINTSRGEENTNNNGLVFKIALYSILAIVLVLWFRQKSKSNAALGINLKRVVCPVCNTKQPIIRMPDSKEQALYGGTSCPNCHTQLDKYGNVIK